MQETRVRSLGQEDLLEKKMATTPVFLPGIFHGQRSLAGDSPWGRRVGHDVVIKQQQQNNRRVSLIILTILMCTIQWH